MTPGILDGLTLTMPEIAVLADVQRPVVSGWRSRNEGTDAPFPEPVDPSAKTLRFPAAGVADWIEHRNAGNNREFRTDLAAVAAVSDDGDTAHSLDTVTALLALAPHLSTPLDAIDADDLVDESDDLDPDDEFAYREIAALGARTEAAARHVAAVAAAGYHPAAAFERLLAARNKLAAAGHLTETVLHPAVLHLAADILNTLAPDTEPLVVADPYPGCGDLLTAVLGRTERVEPATARVAITSQATARMALRRLSAHGWPAVTVAGDDIVDVGEDHTGARDNDVHLVTQIPAVDEPDLDPTEVLRRVDDVALNLPSGRVGIVIGPASALIDRLRDRAAERIRDDLMRSGRVRTVIALPAGMVAKRPRQKTAVWILGDTAEGAKFGEQHIAVADLRDHAPGPAGFAGDVLHDLLTDVIAAQGTENDARAHAFRFARFIRMSGIVAGGHSLLASARPPDWEGATSDPVAVEQHIHELMAYLTDPPVVSDFPTVRISPHGESSAERATVQSLHGRGDLWRLSGHRLDPQDIQNHDGSVSGTVLVIGPAEIRGEAPWGERRIDRLTFTDRYRTGKFTEPGDIVYVTSPRPTAVVDPDGFCVVQSPARILRITDRARDRLVPDMVAADINDAGDLAKDPNAWAVRITPAGQGAALTDAAAALRAQEMSLRDRLDSIADLRKCLLDGVADGVVRIDVSDPSQNERER
ncbi:hypothetical protein [Myceligenerans crystallogenes]|uniref:N-6 DNA Methylase n=1 Tax=Myceligenerans crystallogenes TaxID=316335 RepID=A0ABN2NN03_9MICO